MQPEMMEPACPVKSAVDDILCELVKTIGQRRYDHWFYQKTRFSVAAQDLVVEVGNLFLLNWIQRKFRPTLQVCASKILGASSTLRFELISGEKPAVLETKTTTSSPGASTLNIFDSQTPAKPSLENRSVPQREVPANERARPSPLHSGTPLLQVASALPTSRPFPSGSPRPTDLNQPLNLRQRRYATLEEFQVGGGSQLALTAAKDVCRNPGVHSSCLYLHGGVGLGKTHLLEGIAVDLKQRFPALQVVHMTAENFTNYFTVALRQHSLPSFRQKFRNADVLLLDDVDFLDSKRGIQEELLHTLKHLEAHGRQIVVTSDRHPRLLTRTSDELRTRFQSGMICRLEPPCQETRRKILETKAARMPGEFSPEALNYVAQKFRNNVRELEGALRTLQNYHSMSGKRVGITAARQLLSDLERDCIKVVKLCDIERVVCDLFGLMQEELRSEKRVRSISQPRMLAMYLARKHTRAAYSEIGAYFGGRNHSTVITAEKKIVNLLKDRYQMRVSAQQFSVADVIENIEQQLSQAG